MLGIKMDSKAKREQLQKARAELQELEKAYSMVLKAQAWSTKDGDSSRSVTNQSLAAVSDEIRKKKAEIKALEEAIAGRTSSAMRAGVRW